MQFLVSTTGSTVPLKDLGPEIQNPTTDRDLALEFSPEDLFRSLDLASAIQGGQLTLRISSASGGLVSITADEYEPALVFQSDITVIPNNVPTSEELAATKISTPVQYNTFPLTVSSTTAIANIVVSNSAKFVDYRVSSGDTAYLYGTGGSDGYFTVNYVIDNKKLVTVQSLANTMGTGRLVILYPPGSTKIGVDTTGFINSSASSLQQTLFDLDQSIGSSLTETEHEKLRQLIHFINEGPAEGFASGAYKEVLPANNPFPTQIVWWESSAKTQKIYEKLISYSLGKSKPSPIQWKMYAEDGTTLLTTVTDTIMYGTGPFELNRTRTIV